MRTISMLIASIVAIIAALCVAAASTGDEGPGTIVAAIRHDLPTLLEAPLLDVRLNPTIDWVVADDRDAVAMWHAGQNRGVVALRLQSGNWWWRAAAVATAGDPGVWTPISVPGNHINLCYHYPLNPGPPSAYDLYGQGLIDKALMDRLSDRLRPRHTYNKGPIPVVLCDPDPDYIRSTSEAYDATLVHKQNVGWQWFALSGHAPGGGQKAAILGTDPYYLFSLRVEIFGDTESPPAELMFAGGSTLDVWFPYVLPRNRNYALHVSNTLPEISELSGTLKNNVVHFVLPPFTMQTRDIAHGEIDGVRY